MNEQDTSNTPHAAGEPAAETPVSAAPVESTRRPGRGGGARTGAMGPRVRRDDEPAPTREVVEAAAVTARTTGHRFDLMRYLRLRRRRD